MRNDLERRRIVALGLLVPPDLVKHRALRVEDTPIGIVGCVRAAERIERLDVLSGFGNGAAEIAEQLLVQRRWRIEACSSTATA